MRRFFASKLGPCGVVALGLAACGGGDLDPGAGDDPGTGTGTLAIDGFVHASPRLINGRLGTDFDADFTVRVSLNNQTVTTGSVTITSASGKTPLTYHSDNHWTGTAPAYDQVYVLDAVSGADRVGGVRVDGPDIHVFSAPAQDASVDTAMPLLVQWQHGDQAESTVLRADSVEPIAIPDTGSYSLAPGSLKADKSQARRQTLRLLRTNRVVPSHAAEGSTWSVTIENRLDVIAQPQTRPL